MFQYRTIYAQTRSDFDDLYTIKIDTAIEKGLAYLQASESRGVFSSPRWGQNIGVCSLAGLAFLSRGYRIGQGDRGQAILRIAKRIESQAQASGFFYDERSSSHGPMYEHGFATLFFAELSGTGPSAADSSKLKSAVEVIVRSQNTEGGWRYVPSPTDSDLSVTVCQVMALRAAKNSGIFVPQECIQAAVNYLRKSQNSDGGFSYKLDGGPSRFALTAAAVVAFYNSGIDANSELDKAFNYFQVGQFESGAIFDNYFFYSHYYSAQAFWHRGQDLWRGWYRGLTTRILSMQQKDGRWIDAGQGSDFATAMACLILNTPRSVLPIYQR